MADLYLRFTGLCGFVPREPIHMTPNQARVLLVDTSQPPGGGHAHGFPHEQHVPVLVCSRSFLDPQHPHPTDPREPDVLFFNDQGGEMAGFFLNDQDVSIENTSGDPLKFLNDPSSGSGCHTTANWWNINWMAALAKISPLPSPPPPGQNGSEVVGEDCFDTPPRREVAARVAVTQGTVRNDGLTRGINRFVKWEFKTGGGSSPHGGNQVLAEVVQVQVPIATSPGQVDIVTSLLRQTELPAISRIYPSGFGQRKVIRLTPQGNMAVAVIQNVPYPNLFHLRAPLAGDPEIDSHFEHFYDLSATPQVKRVPHPIRLPQDPIPCRASGPPTVRTPQCPPALFGPHPKA